MKKEKKLKPIDYAEFFMACGIEQKYIRKFLRFVKKHAKLFKLYAQK